jgi:hypothetical protein
LLTGPRATPNHRLNHAAAAVATERLAVGRALGDRVRPAAAGAGSLLSCFLRQLEQTGRSVPGTWQFFRWPQPEQVSCRRREQLTQRGWSPTRLWTPRVFTPHQLVLAQTRRTLAGELTTKKLQRGTHRSVRALNADIRDWIKTADQILDSIAHCCARINDS